MPFLFYGIGFAVCYFLFDLSWWMSLLIAFAAPAIFSLAMWLIGMPIVGISALVEKIKEHRQRPYPEANWADAYEVVEEQEQQEIPLVIKAESFIMYMMDKGMQTRAELSEQGETFGYSQTTIGTALNNLMEAGEIKRIARGVYSKVSSIPGEKFMPEEVTKPQIGKAEEIVAMLLEIEKQRTKQSNTLGIWSLALGIIGIFTFFLPVAAIAAIVLGVLQFRRHITKCSIAGLVLGIMAVALFVIAIKLSYEVPYTVPLI